MHVVTSSIQHYHNYMYVVIYHHVTIGSERGVCTCDGQCECLTSPISGLQFTGSSCDCSPDNNTCTDTTAGNVSAVTANTNTRHTNV